MLLPEGQRTGGGVRRSAGLENPPAGHYFESMNQSAHIRRLLLAVSLLMGLAAVSVASAATVRQLSIKQLTSAAQLILRGRVEAAPAAWHGGRIFRSARIDTAQVLKGPLKAGQPVEVLLPGGVVGDVGQWVPGAPDLKAGEEVLLYLEKRPLGWVVVGFYQGAFTLERDGNRDLWAVRPGHQAGDSSSHRIPFEQLRHLAERL